MKSNQNNTDNSCSKVITKEKFIFKDNIEDHNYLYPNGHRTTNQMKCFKVGKDIGLHTDIAS